jgi:KUP system potassium uptake protein
MANKEKTKTPAKEIIKAMGLVFGDIGTSPIYTITVILVLTPPTSENIMGILSLIFWTMVVLVTVEYVWLAMNLSSKGEGGIIVLQKILVRNLTKGRKIVFYSFLGFIGVSLLMGDGVITPAISILSAVEGLQLIPGIGQISLTTVLIVTGAITILLFAFQHKGTDKVASSFGPIMLVWFSTLFITGLISIVKDPEVIKAVNPYYAIEFFINNGLMGFLVLSEVILCATGGEAVYADMGHLGSEPIKKAWRFVFFALVINYFGQGAFSLTHDRQTNILFEMIKSQAEFLYVPFLILTLMATIIASQAMISAIMSLVYQGITTRIMPLMKVKYTSEELKSQIYIGSVNWGLLIAVLLMIFIFERSENLAAAYGMAVTATMTISALFMIRIFGIHKNWMKFIVAMLVFIVDLIFLGAVMNKLPHGGFWSLVIAFIPFMMIWLWTYGNKALQKSFRSLDLDVYLESYNQLYNAKNYLQGNAIFFVKNLDKIPAYMVHTTIRSGILYEHNVLISIRTTDQPFGVETDFREQIAQGLSTIEVQAGYMEVISVPQILNEFGIKEKVIFYGVDDIATKKMPFKLFAVLKKLAPNFVQFYKLPYSKLHGVMTKLEI